MKKVLVTALILSSLCAATLSVNTAFACPNGESNTPAASTAGNDTSSPYMLTKMSLSIRADSEFVYAVAKNTFTLFISTVPVTVYLYSSPTSTDDITKMTLEAEAHTNDLNVYKEITCKAAHPEQKYWVAHCVYKTDSQTKTATTRAVLYSIDGNALN